jgi:4-amino-4-deoxychorismate lyase
MSSTTWVDGEDRGLQYGDGLFETISCVGGRPRWLGLHLQRLRAGCERLQIRCDDFDALGAQIAAHAAGQERCIVKLIVTRGIARRRGYRPSGDEIPTRILTRHEWPRPPPALAQASPVPQGFRVAISGVRLGMNPLLAGLKHLNRLEQVLAQNAMRDAALEEVLMLSSSGQVIGGSMSNVFFADDSGLFTPALHDCGVAGVMRQVVCAAAERSGKRVQIRAVEAGELARVREAFVTNVRWGLQSIALLEGRALACQQYAQALRRQIDATQP